MIAGYLTIELSNTGRKSYLVIILSNQIVILQSCRKIAILFQFVVLIYLSCKNFRCLDVGGGQI